MPYVDAFVIAVPKAGLEAYVKMARRVGALWMEHGALGLTECVADDVPYGKLTSFPRAVLAREDETVIFSWILYESREHRDAVNAKVIADERFSGSADEMLVDGKRMIFGGFRSIVEL
jgi:uncharacterized protein YbaA (DUF1428 family)